MKRRTLDTLREIRLWIGTLGTLATGAGLILSNEKVKAKIKDLKNKVTNK